MSDRYPQHAADLRANVERLLEVGSLDDIRQAIMTVWTLKEFSFEKRREGFTIVASRAAAAGREDTE